MIFCQFSPDAPGSVCFWASADPLVRCTDSRIRIRTKMSQSPALLVSILFTGGVGWRCVMLFAGCWTPTSWRQWALTSSWLTSTMPSLRISRQEIRLVLMSFCWHKRFFTTLSKIFIGSSGFTPYRDFSFNRVLKSSNYTPSGSRHFILRLLIFDEPDPNGFNCLGSLGSSSAPIVVYPDPVGSWTFCFRLGWYRIGATTRSSRCEFSSIWFYCFCFLNSERNLKRDCKNSKVHLPVWLKPHWNECDSEALGWQVWKD